MRLSKIYLWLPYVLVAAAAFATALAFNQALRYQEGSHKTILTKPPKDLIYFTLGYQLVIADSLWIRVLQNADACGKSGFAEEYDYDQGVDLAKLPECPRSWVYYMLDSITELDPKWSLAHRFGALHLSFFLNDNEGAELIYEKALRRFPNDISLLLSAAYHYLKENSQPQKAAALFRRAVDSGAPEWFLSLAARLYSEHGRLEYAKGILEEYLKKLPPDNKWRKRLVYRLDDINKKLAQAQADQK